MRIPLNWLKQYVNTPASVETLTDRLTMAGHMLDKIEKTKTDTVIDLELRGNRADCYSVYGIAREVSALFNTAIKPLELYKPLKKTGQFGEIKIEIKTPLVKRVTAVLIKNVKIRPSPDWMQKRLINYGIPPINNIVDLTNYVMVETSEPMHAFDLNQLNENILIRMAKNGETMLTFADTRLTLTGHDLVWTSNGKPISVGGAIGGKTHSIGENTKNILVEAASYDRANIRKTIYYHNLFTDAGIRHEKELNPDLTTLAIYRFLQIVKENGWGEIKPAIFDYYPEPVEPKAVFMSYKTLEEIGGIKIPKQKILKILESLNFKTKNNTKSGITVVPPNYRTDIEQEADLIEEVLRIYGYEKNPH